MSATAIPPSPSKTINPELIVEVDLNKRTPKKKPAVQSRLESSPRKPMTPEVIVARQKVAEQRRASIEHQKIEKAAHDVERAKELARKVKTEKENSPAASPVKPQQ